MREQTHPRLGLETFLRRWLGSMPSVDLASLPPDHRARTARRGIRREAPGVVVRSGFSQPRRGPEKTVFEPAIQSSQVHGVAG